MRHRYFTVMMLLAAAAAANPGCLCSSEPTDEERLKQA